MNLSVALDPKDEKFLWRMAKEFPMMVRRAHGLAANNARRRFSSIMKQGGKPDYGVPKFKKHAKLSEELGGKWVAGKKPGSRSRRKMFDGTTAQIATDDNLHVMFVEGGYQHIGFPKKLAKFMGGLLEHKSYAFTPEQQRAFYAAGADHVPMMYERPERHVLEPYAEYLRRGVFAEWTMKIFNKDAKGTLRKGRMAR